MYQMLLKVIRPEELLRMVAFPEFVHFLQVPNSHFPVLLCGNGDLRPGRGRRGDTGS
jgi:hypothetical protein